MAKATLNLSPSLLALQVEAAALCVSFPALLTADIRRFRTLAARAAPELDPWQWDLLGHVLDGIEQLDILGGIDDLPSPGRIAAAIEDWRADAPENELERTEVLRRQVLGWSALAIAGVLFRLRAAP